MQVDNQEADLFILALPIAGIAWKVKHEERVKEPGEFGIRKCKVYKTIAQRNIFLHDLPVNSV